MANNDFIDRLADVADTVLPDGESITLGYLGPDDMVTVYPLPGGEVIGGWMDGSRELSVPYEFCIRTKADQQLAYSKMGAINDALSELDLTIPSANDSYEFEDVTPGKPYLAGVDQQGYYNVLMDITAKIITKGNN